MFKHKGSFHPLCPSVHVAPGHPSDGPHHLEFEVCGRKVSGVCRGGNLSWWHNPWWTVDVEVRQSQNSEEWSHSHHGKPVEARQLKLKESPGAVGPCWPDAVGLLAGQASRSGGKNSWSGSGRSSVRPWRRTMEEDYRSGLEEILANRPAPQKGEAVLCHNCLQCGWRSLPVDSLDQHCQQCGWSLLTTQLRTLSVEEILRGISSIPPTCLPMRKQGWKEI
ncbi:hypothetical protein L3Q82_014863 [Scortum barcoo]|uniref:Uncharacterized protein n=1 Tax=Scortum barcoo TaxID=214431 RepID=A0ACB8VRW4_9TELE|nr:hypothetical protein L3Q82_014863 [Scortum barcoo]